MTSPSNPQRHPRIEAIIAGIPRASDQLLALNRELSETMLAIFDLMRIAVSENPELERFLHAITDQHQISRDEMKNLISYPNVQDLIAGIETGFSLSPSSSVKTTVLAHLMRKIREVETKAFQEETIA